MSRFADARVSLAGVGQMIGISASSVSANAILVNVGTITVTARVVAGLSPTINSPVLITRVGSNWFVTSVLPAPIVIQPPPPSPDTVVTPPSDTVTAPKPTIRTGTLVVSPVSTSTYRDGKWRTDLSNGVDSADTLQGVWPGYGNNTGCAFYGGKPTSLSGATVTRVTLKMHRIQAGVYAAQTMNLRLITQKKRPAGAPTLNESTSGPSLPVGGTTTSFILPNSWGQALVNGTRGGIACTGNPYQRLSGRGSWSSAWVLAISWRRG